MKLTADTVRRIIKDGETEGKTAEEILETLQKYNRAIDWDEAEQKYLEIDKIIKLIDNINNDIWYTIEGASKNDYQSLIRVLHAKTFELYRFVYKINSEVSRADE